MAPPIAPATTPLEWVRRNLFASLPQALMTITFGAVLGYALWRGMRFVLVTARWEIVRRNMTNFLVGDFPRGALWRVSIALLVITLLIGLRWGGTVAARARDPRRAGTTAPRALVTAWPLAFLAGTMLWLRTTATTALLIAGLATAVAVGWAIGRRVSVRLSWMIVVPGVLLSYLVISAGGGVPFGRWKGLMLTVFAAIAGIVLSFPFGVLLAFGRRSTLPAVRALSVGYIELIRGVPLITLLFSAFLLVGLFLPPRTPTPTIATRGMIAIVVFTAAYVAEIVRGGLQSVPRGQVEAAHALGLSAVATTRLIVLPQALRAVIPALVGQFISLYKDTSLLGFIGLTELLGVAQEVTAQPAFVGQGLQAETFLFASLFYWTGSFWMSRASQRLEGRLGVGER
jgi:general L-amino acid transport system permease protein